MEKVVTEVVIIGSGAIGLSVAYQLIKQGKKEIWILEKESYLGGKNTLRCAGGVRSQFSSKQNIELSILNGKLLEEIIKINNNLLNKCGYLFALTDDSSLKSYENAVSLQNSLGVKTKWLSKSDISQLMPIINSENILAGTYLESDGLIDVGWIISYYLKILEDQGVVLRRSCKVNNIYHNRHGLKYVETDNFIIKADVIVNATGSDASDINRMLEIEYPIKAIKQQLFTTSEYMQYKNSYPVVIYPSVGLGFHKDGNGILSGLHLEKDDGNRYLDRRWEIENFKLLVNELKGSGELRVRSRWIGYYDTTPDGDPIIEANDRFNGCFNVFGFSGHGFMHSLAAGYIVSQLILGKQPEIDISKYKGDRFRKSDNKSEIFKI